MKKDIHPKYTPLEIIMTDGTKFTTSSTYNGDSILLDVDFRKHPAWKGGVATVNANANQVADFNKKFGGIFAMPAPKTAE